MISLFLLIILTKSTYYKTSSEKIHELKKKNDKISFLDVLIDTNNNNNFTTSTYKKLSNYNSCTLNFKSECRFRYKKKQLLITWYPMPNLSPPPKQYFIKR